MGRPKRGKTIKKQAKKEEHYSSEDEPNPDSEDFFHDEVDKFHINKEKIALEKEQGSEEEQSDYNTRNIMGLDLEEFEDEDDGDDEDEDEESDDEQSDEESDEESKLPSDKSWGKKKSTFYSADTADANIGKTSKEETWELEKQEGEAAIVLQQRMAAALDEEDFDVANFQIQVEEEKEDDNKDKKTIAIDISKLSKEQKLEILFRDSPELFELLEEFKEKLEEITSVLSPLVHLAKLGKVPQEGAQYLELKCQLYLNYCINIGFYLLLKARQTPVKGHPVIERIVQYRTLIKELEPLDKDVESDIKILLKSKDTLMKNSDSIKENQTQNAAKTQGTRKTLRKEEKKTNTKSKLSALLDESDDEDIQEEQNEPPTKKSKKKKDHEEYSDPLEYYEKVRLEKKQMKELKKKVADAGRLTRNTGSKEDDIEENDDAKRTITYEISKNKGLTAKKKKQARNPRVKHKKKYAKAVIKRSSQVRPVTNEASRYEGEKTGIRAFLTHSIKLK